MTSSSARIVSLLSWLALSSSLALSACGGTSGKDPKEPQADPNDPLAGAPAWVTGDCGQHFEGKSVLCGVGTVSGVKSPSLARNTAMARGRTEIARYLTVQVKSVLTDYQAQVGGSTEQEIEERSEQISEMTLSGSRMAAYHIAKDGTYYALMALELESFKDSVEGASGIDAELKQALVENATKTFSVRDSEVSPY